MYRFNYIEHNITLPDETKFNNDVRYQFLTTKGAWSY